MIGLVMLTEFRYRRRFWLFGPRVLDAPHAGNVVKCPACSHVYGIGPNGVFRPALGGAPRVEHEGVAHGTPEDPRERLIRESMTREHHRAKMPLKPKEPPPV